MLRDNLVGLIVPRRSCGKQALGDEFSCLENPRPLGAESSLTGRCSSPFQTEPRHHRIRGRRTRSKDYSLLCRQISSLCCPAFSRCSACGPLELRGCWRRKTVPFCFASCRLPTALSTTQ